MSILKCKMCGGDLEVTEEIKIVECDYCGTKQTVPNADNEKKVNLFNRANRLRMASEFDKAAGIYENIIAEFPEEAEAYWGLCLCNYGIEYVDDPATAKKIPTCHRASFESLQKDENFELALEYADVVAQKVYRDEAREIDRIMSEILDVSKNEKPYDVFICYKETDDKGGRTVDSVLAYDIYEALTAKGFNVFFSRVTLEDKLGMQYEPYIFAALNSAKVMLSIGTKYEYFHAVWVKNEWSRFRKLMKKDKSKVLIPCFKDIDAYDMPDEFKGLQAQDLGKLGAVQDIVRGVEKIIPKTEASIITEKVVASQSGGPNVEALLKRGNMALEDKEWDAAKEFFNQVLNMDAECAEAYLGLAMADEKVCNLNIKVFNLGNRNLLRAKQFADNDLLDKISIVEKNVNEEFRRKEAEKIKKAKAAEEERVRKEKAAKEERIRKEKEDEEKRKENIIKCEIARKKLKKTHNIISAGYNHIVGLKSDGTVVAVGNNSYGQCNVNGWTDIVAVSAGSYYTAGLKSDGTVVATGKNDDGQCDVSSWKNVIAISAGSSHTAGLKSDGSVIVVGGNFHGQCNVNGWTDIIDIFSAYSFTVGLKSDGTVVVAGSTRICNVKSWFDIVTVAAGSNHTAAIKFDGSVVADGIGGNGQCNVAGWRDIEDVSVGGFHSVGLKSDGRVVAVGSNRDGRCNVNGWTDIVAVAAGDNYTVAVKSDGTVVATGDKADGKLKVNSWKLFYDFENFEEERRVKLEEKKRIEEQKPAYRSQGLCQHCGGTFKGLFTKKCSVCGKVKDY